MEHKEPDKLPENELVSAYGLTERPSTEVETVRQAMQGDKEAFSTLFMQTYRSMYQVVRGILQKDEDIYDALQNGYAKAYQYLPRLQAPEAFLIWLKKTMENTAKDIWSVTTGREWAQDNMEEFADELTVEYSEASERRLDIQDVLSRLDPRQAEVLTLHYYDGMKLSEIARLLHEPASTVRSRFARAKKTLVEQLKIKGIDKSLYGGSLSTMIAVSLRSLIGTDVLSAATAQQMLDGILEGRQSHLGAAAYKILEAQRNRTILRAVSLLMALTVTVTCVTVALLNGFPWKWFSLPPVAGPAVLPAEGSEPPDIFGETSFSGTGAGGTETAGPDGTTQSGQTVSDPSTSSMPGTQPTTSLPSATSPDSAPTSTESTTSADSFVPDYEPGQANTVGNTPNNLGRNRGFVAKQADWLYFSEGNAYRVLMKMKTDGSQKQLIAENSHGFEYINVIGDWIYYCGNGIWRIRTDGSHRELISSLNARHLHVIGNMAYFSVETIGYTIYKMNLDTQKTTTLKSNVAYSPINVINDHLLYYDQEQLQVLQLKTNKQYTLAACDIDFLVDGDLAYLTQGKQLISVDYTDPDTPLKTVGSVSGGLLFVSPYQGGIIGCWPMNASFAYPQIVSTSGTTLQWKSTVLADAGYNFYTFGDDYVYFYTPELTLHRARADGSGFQSFS